MDNSWYYYDPDNRKRPKREAYCIRCCRGINDVSRAIKVELHPENPWIRVNVNGNYLLGPECRNTVFTSENKKDFVD